jgi:hypothetical protein
VQYQELSFLLKILLEISPEPNLCCSNSLFSFSVIGLVYRSSTRSWGKYDINAIPMNFLIDKDGKVIARDLKETN